MKTDLKDLFDRLEKSKLTPNHIKVITAAVVGDMLEFFDLFLIAFALAFIVGPWQLNYMQSSIVILSSGFGAIFGAIFFGTLADKIGRRPIFIATILVFSLATGAMYFTPEGGWIFLSFFRFIVGFGVGGLYCVDMPLVQEYVPSRFRGIVGAAVLFFIPIGTVINGVIASYLNEAVGWRYLFLIGLAPAFFTLLVRMWVPESPRWLVSQGRYQEAGRSIAWVLGDIPFFSSKGADKIEIIADIDSLPPELTKSEEKVSFLELFKYPRSVIVNWVAQIGYQTAFYGYNMWGPSLLVLILGITPAAASGMYVWVPVCGCLGVIFSGLSAELIGRRWTVLLTGGLGGLLLIVCGVNHDMFIAGVSAFWIFLLAANFFIQGGFGAMSPYTAEFWPKRLKATGLGSAYGVGGAGKLIGPVAMAVFAGTTNIVTPKATIGAIAEAFTFLGIFGIIGGLVALAGRETKGKTIEEIDQMVRGGKDAEGLSLKIERKG
jgi:putative MFS transporter